jgi:hypothetical protein
MSSGVTDYTQITNRFMSDQFIIRRIAEKEWYGGVEPKLNTGKLEKRAKLRPLPSHAVPAHVIKWAVGNLPPAIPETSAQTFRKQIDSLLSGVEIDQIQQLKYFISRIIIGHLPRSPNWAIHQEDLDYFTSALFIINSIATRLPKAVEWIMLAQGGDDRDWYRFNPTKLIPRTDSALMPSEPNLLQHAKDLVLAPGFQPLREFCVRRSRKKAPISLQDEQEKSNIPKPSVTRYDLAIINLILTERYISNMMDLGCRYRWVLTDRARNYFQSEGLITRYDLYSFESLAAPDRLRILSRDFGYSNFDEIKNERERKRIHARITRSLKSALDVFSGMEGITAHLEPLGTEEPSLPVGGKSFTTEHEIISYRMDLFNTEKMKWNYTPWSNPSQWATGPNKWNPRKTSWLMRDTSTMKKKDWEMTDQDVQLLFNLLANRGSFDFRHVLLKLLGLSHRLRTLNVERLIQHRVVEVLYHPSLEYSGLQGGLLVVVPEAAAKSTRALIGWLLGAFPYVHVFWSESGSLLAVLRMPGYASFTASFLRNYLPNQLLDTEGGQNFTLGIIRDESTYNLSLPARLYNPNTRKLNNPYEAGPRI